MCRNMVDFKENFIKFWIKKREIFNIILGFEFFLPNGENSPQKDAELLTTLVALTIIILFSEVFLKKLKKKNFVKGNIESSKLLYLSK